MSMTSRRGLTVRGIAVAAGVVLVMGLAAPVSAAAASSGGAAAGTPTRHAGKVEKPPKPPKSPKPPKPPKHPRPPKGAGAPPVDISATVPRTMRDDITGHFVDGQAHGYYQRMRAENSSLDVYNSPAAGGQQLSTQNMDLVLAPSSGVDWLTGGHLTSVYYAGSDAMQQHMDVFHVNTVYLANNDQHVFMTGTQGGQLDEFQPPGSVPNPYRNYLYQLPTDGSCAAASCAQAIVRLPDAWNLRGVNAPGVAPRAIIVTSLAAGFVGTHPYLAVGLSDGGVQIYDVNGPTPRLTSTFDDMAPGDGSQATPTALAWDPAASGLLAIGVMGSGSVGYFVTLDPNGNVLPGSRVWTATGGPSLDPTPLSAAITQGRHDPVVAFGMTDQTLKIVDPSVTSSTPLASGNTVNCIVAINPIPPIDGTGGPADFAVSLQSDPSDATVGGGQLLRWDGTSNPLKPQPLTLDTNGNPNTLLPDRNSFRTWFPGLKEGRFKIQNSSGEPISVSLQARSDADYGCWYAPTWADAPAFPARGVSVRVGQTSAPYTMGAYTAGANGGCAATDATGTWRGYLVITPVNHPADARLVGLRLNRNRTVDVDDQAGGSTTASITQNNASTAALGLWTVTVDTPSAPTPATQPPTVAGSRVTPADVTGPAVYRFDVTSAVYQLPTPYPNQLVVPPLQVQGFDGTSWTTLGTLIPRTEPTITGNQLTLGPATFWWENPAGQPAYQQIRVGLRPNGVPTTVTLSSLPAPPDPTNISGPTIAATSSTGIAAPVDSGLDQAPLSVQVLDNNSQPLPDTDPSYQRIFYRNDNTNALITNLLLTGADPNSLIGVSPYVGAYPNNGSVSSSQNPGLFHYLSTTSTDDQHITGYIAGATSPSSPIEVHAPAIAPVTSATSAANGISLAGCADFTNGGCRLYPISASQPAPYLDTKNGIQIGLLTAAAVATTSTQILPLQQTAGTTDHLLASSTLNQTTNPNAPTLTDTSAFLPTDHVDTTLVTHGVLVSVINIPVGD
jgi:hypothetical protein